MKNQDEYKIRRDAGLTVVEVLFAMVIVLVGLIGIAAMVPFAARQAEDSYKITQALNAGESALGLLNSESIIRPRLDAQWQFIEDEYGTNDSESSFAKSWNDFYRRMGPSRGHRTILFPIDKSSHYCKIRLSVPAFVLTHCFGDTKTGDQGYLETPNSILDRHGFRFTMS